MRVTMWSVVAAVSVLLVAAGWWRQGLAEAALAAAETAELAGRELLAGGWPRRFVWDWTALAAAALASGAAVFAGCALSARSDPAARLARRGWSTARIAREMRLPQDGVRTLLRGEQAGLPFGGA